LGFFILWKLLEYLTLRHSFRLIKRLQLLSIFTLVYFFILNELVVILIVRVLLLLSPTYPLQRVFNLINLCNILIRLMLYSAKCLHSDKRLIDCFVFNLLRLDLGSSLVDQHIRMILDMLRHELPFQSLWCLVYAWSLFVLVYFVYI